MKNNEQNKSEEIIMEKLFRDLNKMRLPVSKMEEKESFKNELKAKLLFEFTRKQEAESAGYSSLIGKFFAIFKNALVTAVLMPFLVLGSMTTYAYMSPQVYDGHILYPLKISIEKIEMEMERSPKDKIETKLKLAERKLDEVLAMKDDGKRVEKNTLSQVADFTLSAMEDIKDVSKEEEKDYLKQKINEFSERQMKTIAAISEDNGLSFSNAYFTFESKQNEEDALPIFDPMGEELSSEEVEVEISSSTVVSSSSENEIALTAEDEELKQDMINIGAENQIVEKSTDGQEVQIPNEVETLDTSSFTQGKSGNTETPSELTPLSAVRELATEVIQEKRVAPEVTLDKSGEKEALGYLWNITNQIKAPEAREMEQSQGINTTRSVSVESNTNDKEVHYSPKLRFNPSFEKYKLNANEYLLQVDAPFSFSVTSFFVDTFNLEVPASIYDNSIEIYLTKDNSDPFTSNTKILYKAGQLIEVDRSFTFRFVAVSKTQVSPVYTVQISFIEGGKLLPINEKMDASGIINKGFEKNNNSVSNSSMGKVPETTNNSGTVGTDSTNSSSGQRNKR